MKRLGRVLGNLLAVALTVVSLQSMAETQLGGRDFNHMATGFPLSGGHATAACETCHVGGVFRGTPRNCDGCHAVGRRIVATPKSNTHIVTDAPCESCHFNTATWLGARYNHGTARPGQCTTCHNARIAQGKPVTHNVGKKATDSCDHCHRTTAWLPSSWNHIGVAPGTCASAGCHVAGSNIWFKPASHSLTIAKNTFNCDDCHGFVAWTPARFKHTRPSPSGVCKGCHDGVTAAGKIAGHIATVDDCNQCHFSTFAWSPALGAKPANHIPYNAGVACTNCHAGLAKVNPVTLHTYSVASSTCATCHITPNAYTGNNQKTRGNHDGSSGNNCTGCHEHQGAGSYGKW